MNFPGNILPNFSVPPPPIHSLNNGSMGMRPNTMMAHQQSVCPNGPGMHNQPFSPLNQMSQPSHGQLHHPNFPMSGQHHYQPRGRGFNRPPIHQNRGKFGPSPNPPFNQQKPVNYGSDDIFGVTTYNANSHHNSHQQNINTSPSQSFPGHRGRGFQSGRGRRGSNHGGRGNFHHKNNHHNNNGDQGDHRQPHKKKKEKIDKRDLPENNVFFCDICDRGFKTEEKYKEHVDGHQKCSYKDCPFSAAPKLVQLHISMQHRGGLAKKVWSVESEEDIKKWREERKRNYPTAANIQRKKELQAERAQRGQVLETKEFGKMKERRGRRRDQGRGRGRGRHNRGRRRGKRHGDHSHASEDSEDNEDDGPPEEMKIVRSCHQEEIYSTDKADEKEDQNRNDPTEASTQLEASGTQSEEKNVSSLSLLVGYGSMSSDEDENESDNGETSACNLHKGKDVSPQTNKVANAGDGKSEMETLLHSFNGDKESQESTSTNSPHQQQHIPATCDIPAASPAHENSPTDSLSSYDKDPFNLNVAGPAFPDISKRENQQVDSSDLDKVVNEMVNSLPDKQIGEKEIASKTAENNLSEKNSREAESIIDSSRVEDSPPDFPIDDSEIFSEIDNSHGESLMHENMSKSGCESFSGQEQKNGNRQGTKRKHMSSAPGPDGKNKDYRTNDDRKMRRTNHHRPQAKSYTLLEKLLAPQIRQERNKILQCVFFIVKHKFFDEEPMSSKA